MTRKVFNLILIFAAVVLALTGVFFGVQEIKQRQQKQQNSAIQATQTASSLLTFPGQVTSSASNSSSTPTGPFTHPTGMPYVQGTQVVDGSGHPFFLRGAQIESAFNYINSWQAGVRLNNILNSNVFNAMVHDWKMNIMRLPLSNWIWAKDTANYMHQLDQVIAEANTAGLFVVFDLHDDGKAGSPYGDNADLPKAEDIPFWKAIASHYKDNNMVMFDIYNEPKATTWPQWLHGGGTVAGATVVGHQNLVDAIRSVGAKQIIVVEPGSAGGRQNGWASIGNYTISDPNIMYSLHVYDNIGYDAQQDDALWGPILNHHPLYYGEWALLPNGYGIPGYDHCKNIVHSQADQIVQNFMNYMTSRNANWTAWSFTTYHLIMDYTNFTPTTLDIPWTCGNPNGRVGMGTLVKQFMNAL